MEALDDSILKHSKKSISGLRIQSFIICAIFSIVHFFELNLIWHKTYGNIDCSTPISFSSLDRRYFSIYSNFHYSEYPNYFSCHSSINPYLYIISYFLGYQVSLILAFWKSLDYSPKKCFTIACLISLILIEFLSLVSFYWISLMLKFFLGISNGFITQNGIILMMDWSHSKYVAFRGNCLIGSKVISLIFLVISIKLKISIKVSYFIMAILLVVLILFQLIFVKESKSYLKKIKNYDLLIHYLRSLARKVDYHGEAIVESNLNKMHPCCMQSQQLISEASKDICPSTNDEDNEILQTTESDIKIKNSLVKYFWISLTL
uniref:Uncharacterized protein n=1 Tax=Strongyloides papillosus TaxID=174720 RepID=A0A0N5CD59_STREA